jgi:hypothetical protein
MNIVVVPSSCHDPALGGSCALPFAPSQARAEARQPVRCRSSDPSGIAGFLSSDWAEHQNDPEGRERFRDGWRAMSDVALRRPIGGEEAGVRLLASSLNRRSRPTSTTPCDDDAGPTRAKKVALLCPGDRQRVAIFSRCRGASGTPIPCLRRGSKQAKAIIAEPCVKEIAFLQKARLTY